MMRGYLYIIFITMFLLITINCYAMSFNEEVLDEQLKGKPLSGIVNILGNPTVKKPCKECLEEDSGYWWYKLEDGISILVAYSEGKVIDVRVITEEERPKEL